MGNFVLMIETSAARTGVKGKLAACCAQKAYGL